MNLETTLQKLWTGYSDLNPSAHKIHSLLENQGERIINDHIAFRTYDIDGINIDALASIFIKMGYEAKGEYSFEKKKLRARHYEHKSDNLAPRVFISELITGDFSKEVQEIAAMVARKTLESLNNEDELIFAGTPWHPLSYKVYKKLLGESEYAAWMYVWGFRANHFTIFINHLKKYTTIEDLNEYLKSAGFSLNISGGEIKGSREQLLQQSSTLADIVEVEFDEGLYSIPCCYYEFAQRYEDKTGNLYNGFIAKSADKIFESTDSRE